MIARQIPAFAAGMRFSLGLAEQIARERIAGVLH